MKNISMILFFMMLVTSTLITINSETWLGMWMGMEINLIAFLPIMYKTKNTPASESCMIYFLIQSMGSILMLMAVLNNMLFMISPVMNNMLFNMLLMFSMMIKLGIPPFHFWFPEILNKMNWFNGAIIMSWQKINPLVVLSYIMINIMPAIIMITVIVGAMGGLNQTSIRKIMAYSSINHMGWMLACMKFNNEMWMNYLMIYMFIILIMCLFFYSYSMFYINNMINNNMSLIEKFTLTSLFMSLGGLPPFLGFLPKWMVISNMITTESFLLLSFMIISSLIILFFYLRLISSNMMIYSSSMKFTTYYDKYYLMMFILIINLTLPVLAAFSF
uniref:NADH-ubiquinone oxidoreductase chain 2 n=1 Tax=Opistoplatys sp. HL-2013 TaxID=1347747 RepID=A0A7I6HH29_9HEMI|nr:NADH dehydrogenase subunit 2 [Opistoplatys sp. HL-2013]